MSRSLGNRTYGLARSWRDKNTETSTVDTRLEAGIADVNHRIGVGIVWVSSIIPVWGGTCIVK